MARVVAVNRDGSVVVRFSDLVNRHFVLGEFFDAWGFTFGSAHIGRAFSTTTAPMKMTVNGANNTSFDNWGVVGGSTVLITVG